MVLIYTPLTNDTKHLFMCSSAICLSSLVKHHKIFANFKIGLFFFLLLIVKSSSYILDTGSLSGVLFAMFYPNLWLSLHFLNGCFEARKVFFFYFDEVKFINFSFRFKILVSCLKTLSNPRS